MRIANVDPLPDVSTRFSMCAFCIDVVVAGAGVVVATVVDGVEVAGVTVGSGSAFAIGSTTTGAAGSAIGSTCGTSVAGAEVFSAMAAGIVTVIDLSFADAVGRTDCARWNVTRVNFVPISVASSAVMDVTPAGSEAGMATAEFFVVEVRSTTKTAGDGL